MHNSDVIKCNHFLQELPTSTLKTARRHLLFPAHQRVEAAPNRRENPLPAPEYRQSRANVINTDVGKCRDTYRNLPDTTPATTLLVTRNGSGGNVGHRATTPLVRRLRPSSSVFRLLSIPHSAFRALHSKSAPHSERAPLSSSQTLRYL
jgi:hypothetical protein